MFNWKCIFMSNVFFKCNFIFRSNKLLLLQHYYYYSFTTPCRRAMIISGSQPDHSFLSNITHSREVCLVLSAGSAENYLSPADSTESKRKINILPEMFEEIFRRWYFSASHSGKSERSFYRGVKRRRLLVSISCQVQATSCLILLNVKHLRNCSTAVHKSKADIVLQWVVINKV